MAVYIIGDKEFQIEKKSYNEKGISAIVNGEKVSIDMLVEGKNLWVRKEGVLIPVFFARDELNNIHIQIDGEQYRVHQKTLYEQAGGGNGSLASGRIEPPMPGKVLKVMVREGDSVEENQVILLMESMKLQVEVKAPFDGVVKALNVKEGQTVNAGELIVEIEKTV